MFRSWKIGRAFGVDIFVHWSFVILPIVIVISTKSYGWVKTPLALAFVFLAFACVTLHEYGHILAARLFGIGTRDIILTPLGGIARMKRMSEKPVEEIIIALAGPTVNVAIGVLMVFGMALTCGFRNLSFDLEPENQYASLRGLASILMVWNFIMFFFNLAPAFPMDGGRILRAVIALFVDRLTATRIAVYVGFGVAGLFILIGLRVPNAFMFVLIGLFVMTLGPLELAMLRQQEAMRQGRAERSIPEAEDVAPVPIAPPEPNFSGYTWDPRFRAWIEWRDGWPIRKFRMHAW